MSYLMDDTNGYERPFNGKEFADAILGLRGKPTVINDPERLRKEALALLDQANALEESAKYEPEPNDTVISWEAVEHGRKRTFVAVKAGNRWWTTAVSSPQTGSTWQSMCARWPGLRKGQFWIAAKWDFVGEDK